MRASDYPSHGAAHTRASRACVQRLEQPGHPGHRLEGWGTDLHDTGAVDHYAQLAVLPKAATQLGDKGADVRLLEHVERHELDTSAVLAMVLGAVAGGDDLNRQLGQGSHRLKANTLKVQQSLVSRDL